MLHVLNVVPDQGMAIVSASMSADHNASVVETAKHDLKSRASAKIPSEISVECHIARGTIYDQIIKNADNLGADCIIVGAHSPELKDYLIGPNAARVARPAEQSVFVIR